MDKNISSKECAKVPRISVVTPSYNQADTLESTIRSVLDQGYPDIEYIVMDGGSTDASVDILRKFDSKFAFWQSKQDGGQSAGINLGMARATGDIACWLNSDDRWVPGTLNRIATVFRDNPDVQWLVGIGTYENKKGKSTRVLPELLPENGKRLNTEWFIDWPKNAVLQPSVFWRRDLWLTVGGLDESLHCAMDFDLWLKFSAIAPAYFISENLSISLFHPGVKSYREASTSLLEVSTSMSLHGRRDKAIKLLKPYMEIPFFLRNKIWPFCPAFVRKVLKRIALR